MLLALNVSVSLAQIYSENKNIAKRYKVYPNSTIDISNKYGKVEIVNWEKDSVSIEATLKIQTPSSYRMTKLRNTIDFDLSDNNHYIIAKTVFLNNGNALINGIKTIAETIAYSGDEVKIDYIVTVPKNINLHITNKYGDVYVDDIEGDIKLTVANGGLKANTLAGNVYVDLSFGDGSINKMTKGQLTLSYGDLTLKDSKQITLDSKWSKINIENCESLKVHSRHDKIQLGSLNILTGETDFTSIWIGSLTEELNLNMKYGSISTDYIRKSFSFVNINSELADLNLFFERGSTFQYDITYYKDAIVRLPKEAVKSDDKFASGNMTLKFNDGHVGSPESASKVKLLAAKKASVNLFIK